MAERCGRWCAFLLTLTLVTSPSFAITEPQDSPLRAKEFRHGRLHIVDKYAKATEIPAEISPAVRNVDALGVSPATSYLDVRSGRWGALLPAEPLLPGQGVGNDLTFHGLGLSLSPSLPELERLAWEAFVGYLQSHEDTLLVDVSELANPGRVTVHEGGALVQIHAPRVVDGLPVRNSFLTAVVRHGNLILFGSRNWADVRVTSQPALSAADARAVVQEHLGTALASGWHKSSLAFVPMNGGESIGEGVSFRLAWALRPTFAGDPGRWEALVDAHSGELLAFEDQNHYGTSAREVEGGVYPRSNDGIGPEGSEQPDFPMPFADILNNGQQLVTDSGGNLPLCVDGDITTSLAGPFVRMADNCGAISETTGLDVLDLGFDPGTTDCAVPAGAPSGSPGNTHASRTGFYELNRLIEMAQSHLPDNPWLQQQLTSNMNINNTCNAFWNGATVNFYRSGGGCGNTGELAGVFDHEWGHGMDDNDANGFVSSPGEGIADIFAYARLADSCIGPGFRGTNCTGFGDPCTDCTGVRDIDFAKRASGQPHDVAWIDANCPLNQSTPCGSSTHCEGAVYAEAFFDLINRDLPGLYAMDFNTAFEVANRLAFIGSGPVGAWFQCIIGFGGCNADGGYLNFLAVDDDNGTLADGTPHMQAIFDAFNRHGIACDNPVVSDSGCADRPSTAPTVMATPQDRGVLLTWNDVGADHYKVYRTDGVLACDFGKAIVERTPGTSFLDTGLKNGHDYSYIVIPFGSEDSCFGPSSSCVPVEAVPGPNMAVGSPSAVDVLKEGSDGDMCIDNCEQVKVTFDVTNIGEGLVTNPRILDVVPLSHPSSTILTPLPFTVAPTLAACAVEEAMVTFRAEGLAAGDTVVLRIDFTSDELAPQVLSKILEVSSLTECDFEFFASRLFNFEADLEGWQTVSGTFVRGNTNGGADGTSFGVDSSAFLNGQCDKIDSPVLALSATSTLSMWTNFDIEPQSASTWYDRANVAIEDVDGTSRTVINPSGRVYNADSSGPGNFSGCNDPEEGWADTMSTWAISTWDSAALGAPDIAGQKIRLNVTYGTDGALANQGFSFDQVTITDVEVQTDDTSPDVCPLLPGIFTDGFETGDTSRWSNEIP